jgi:hypothetical protein
VAEPTPPDKRLDTNNNGKILNDCDNRGEILNDASLGLVEAANGISDDSYRRQAVVISDTARTIVRIFDVLRKNHAVF